MSPPRRTRGAARPEERPAGPSLRWTRWLAYALIVLYAGYWAAQAFTIHRVGSYGVETDFYWKYGPAARDLTSGRIDIANYDSKGWGYPATVALLSLTGLDTFRAGQWIALASAVIALVLLYRLHRSLFGPAAALAALLLVAGNVTFLENTYLVGTDMFFLAVWLASIALLLRSGAPGWRSIAASGLLAGWAFSTRYNGLVLWPGALALFLLFRIPPGTRAAAWRRAGIWTGAFVLAALPWLWINAAHTGSPLTNNNYMNVGYTVYGEGNWERFFYGRDRPIRSFADVVMLDPGKFAGAMARNVGDHFWRDLVEMTSPPWGVLAVLGAALLVLDRPDRRVGGYFVFFVLGFLSLVPVFYGTRFSLPLLPFYAALAAWPVASPTLGRALARIERTFPARAFLFLALWIAIAVSAYAWTQDDLNDQAVSKGAYELAPAVGFLREQGDGALLARKPHAAFLSRREFVPMPTVPGPDSLHAIAVREKARFVLVSGAEWNMRSNIRPIVEGNVPGFRRVFESESALLFEVVPKEPASYAP